MSISYRIQLTFVVAIVTLALPTATTAQQALDVLIAGATVYDGTGAAGRVADVGIRGDRIVFVGRTPAGTNAPTRITASGLVVSPGGIDPHTHTYEGLPRLNAVRRQNASSLMQGITTVVNARNVVEIRILEDVPQGIRLELFYETGDYSLIDAQAFHLLRNGGSTREVKLVRGKQARMRFPKGI